MADKYQGPKVSSLNAAIDELTLVEEVLSITPAGAVLGTVTILLTMIQVGFPLFCDGIFITMINEWDCVDGLSSVEPSTAGGMNGKKLDILRKSGYDSIDQLTA